MREIGNVRQDTEGLRRRWFTDPAMDLYLWQDAAGAIVRFQICYKLADEHALTWDEKRGWEHHRVDDGEQRPGRFRTPILVANGGVDTRVIAALLHGVRHSLGPAIYGFVAGKLQDLAGDRSGAALDADG